MFKIEKIYLKNFKTVKEKTLEFSGYDYVVFDGPNGFGKTTIFDAIELSLIGRIDRLASNITQDRKGAKDNVLQKNGSESESLEVKLQLRLEGEVVIIGTTWVDPNGTRERNGHKFTQVQYPRYLLATFEDQLTSGKLTSQNEINGILGFGDIELSEYFHLLFYVQQEETLSFLKSRESDRAKKLNKLFQTENQARMQTFFKNAVDSIKKRIATWTPNLKIAQDKLAELSFSSAQETQEVVYSKLLPEDKKVEWDEEGIKIRNDNVRVRLVEEVQSLADFVNDLPEFEDFLFNEELKQLLLNRALLEKAWILRFETQNSTTITQMTARRARITSLLLKFELGSDIAKLTDQSLAEYEDLGDTKIELSKRQAILELIDRIQNLAANASTLSETARVLNEIRSRLWKGFEKLLKDQTDVGQGSFQSQDCPLCGNEYKNEKELISKIEDQREKIVKLFDDASAKRQELSTELYTSYIKDMERGLNNVLAELDAKYDSDLSQRVVVTKSDLESIERWGEWLAAHILDKTYLHSFEFKISKESRMAFEIFLKELQQLERSIAKPEEQLKKYKTLYFKPWFDSKIEKAKAINTPEWKKEVQAKVTYLNARYFHSQSKKRTALELEIDMWSQKITRGKDREQQCKDIRATIEAQIRQYWMDSMGKIEIPFYIYSGKILQEHHQGAGIFIAKNEVGGKAKGKVDDLRFVFDSNTDHDALHTFSSGQLAALSISFMLALNRVFESPPLGFILIDDPVQTMDDLNTISFVDLLRNEFSDRQIIIATHEDDFSLFSRYKFEKAGFKTKRVDVSKEFFPV